MRDAGGGGAGTAGEAERDASGEATEDGGTGTARDGSADGPGDAARGAPGGAPARAGDPAAERERMFAAIRASQRVLAGSTGGGETVRERMDRLRADAPAAYDLDGWTDVYGNDDGIVGDLERRTADALGTEAAAFFPTGTMAQQVALRCWAGRTGNATVAGHPLSHLEVHERDAYAVVSGLRMVHPTSAARPPTAAEVYDLPEPFGTLALELPLRDAGFVLPSWDELTAVVAAARDREAVVHLDGARLWECGPHFGRSLPEITALADSVYVSYYKSLDGISGAALAGTADFIDEARAWRHRYGGQLFQQWPAALAALIGLDRELPRLPEYVAHAQTVARALGEGLADAGVPWFRVHPEPPHTHEFQVWLPHPPELLNEAAVRQAEETGTALFRRWFEPASARPPGVAMTEVTVSASALRWTAGEVRAAVGEFVSLVDRIGEERVGG
ncbi:threonine aldolase family protein [Streptomyces sioyaensis]|uniref:threonine aldolase family protein n=1 Tax=Streptomyces sioyaensis TaxID=67364 RepID=UPI00368AEB55